MLEEFRKLHGRSFHGGEAVKAKMIDPAKNKELRSLLQKFDYKLFNKHTNSLNVFRSFDVDGDGISSYTPSFLVAN